jgi:ribosomal protein S27E
MCTKITTCFFYKKHKNKMKYLKCGKSRFVEVVNEDGEKVTTKVAHKQLHFTCLLCLG